MLRKIVAALVLVLLAVMMVAFAVANPQIVTVSLDLVGSNESITSVTLPLFALIIFSASIGVVMGGLAAWARQGKCPGTARRLERQVQALRKKITALEGTASGPTITPDAGDSPRRKAG